MEYLLGAIVTAITIFGVAALFRNKFIEAEPMKIRYSQAHIFNIVKPFIPATSLLFSPAPVTQASVYENSMYMRVVFADSQAYWIKDNTFYTADMSNGLIDSETTRIVDIMGMDDVQLKKAMLIVEKLTEGMQNDRGSSRN